MPQGFASICYKLYEMTGWLSHKERTYDTTYARWLSKRLPLTVPSLETSDDLFVNGILRGVSRFSDPGADAHSVADKSRAKVRYRILSMRHPPVRSEESV